MLRGNLLRGRIYRTEHGTLSSAPGAARQRIIHEGIGNDAFVHVFDVVPSEGDIGYPACGRMNSE